MDVLFVAVLELVDNIAVIASVRHCMVYKNKHWRKQYKLCTHYDLQKCNKLIKIFTII